MTEEMKKQLFNTIQGILEENLGNRLSPTLIEGILNRIFREFTSSEPKINNV